ncbi:hypothetical protein C8R45DRAFT_1046369 [Mycena sanguinolenta]|nr:hypothetical protein C8R45DRAFT_1046369 [Mycena sanguinolenta]
MRRVHRDDLVQRLAPCELIQLRHEQAFIDGGGDVLRCVREQMMSQEGRKLGSCARKNCSFSRSRSCRPAPSRPRAHAGTPMPSCFSNECESHEILGSQIERRVSSMPPFMAVTAMMKARGGRQRCLRSHPHPHPHPHPSPVPRLRLCAHLAPQREYLRVHRIHNLVPPPAHPIAETKTGARVGQVARNREVLRNYQRATKTVQNRVASEEARDGR